MAKAAIDALAAVRGMVAALAGGFDDLARASQVASIAVEHFRFYTERLDYQHDPEECGGRSDHCFYHHLDEGTPPGQEPYRVCGECGHVYPTEGQLADDFNGQQDKLFRQAEANGREPRDTEPPEPLTADRIFSCAWCGHDF